MTKMNIFNNFSIFRALKAAAMASIIVIGGIVIGGILIVYCVKCCTPY